MKKSIKTFLLITLFGLPGYSQNWGSLFHFGIPNADDGTIYSVASDDCGNRYVVAQGNAGLTLGGVDVSGKAFIAKMSRTGVVAWVDTFRYTTNVDNKMYIQVAGDGSVYVGGRVTMSSDLVFYNNGTPDILIVPNHTGTNYGGGFVAKYNASGQYQWGQRRFNDGQFATGEFMFYNNTTNQVVLTGMYRTNRAVWTYTFDKDGNELINKVQPASYTRFYDYDYSAGAIYGAGVVDTDNASNNDWGNSVSTLPALRHGAEDAAIAKLNALSEPVWAIRAGGTGNDRAVVTTVPNAAYLLAVIYCGSDSLNYRGVGGQAQHIKNQTPGKGFFAVAKVDTGNGDITAIVPVYNDSVSLNPLNINVTASGEIVVTGRMRGTLVSGALSVSGTHASRDDNFIATFNADLSAKYLTIYGIRGQNDEAGMSVADTKGNVLLFGRTKPNFNIRFTYGDSTNTTMTNARSEWFILEYGFTPYVPVPVPTVAMPAICRNDTLNITLQPNAAVTSYAWAAPGAGYFAPDGASAKVSYTAAGNQVVKVVANAECGVSDTVNIPVKVNQLPTATPQVSGSDISVSEVSGFSYQWFMEGGSPVSGAESAAYTATVTGNYYVQITDTNSCVGNSSLANVTITSLGSTGAEKNAWVYPNPAVDEFYLNVPAGASYTLYDQAGRPVAAGAGNRVAVAHLEPGMYVLETRHGAGVQRVQVIKK